MVFVSVELVRPPWVQAELTNNVHFFGLSPVPHPSLEERAVAHTWISKRPVSYRV